MRLEDALFYLALNADTTAPELCRALIGVGVDVVQIGGMPAAAAALVEVCRAEDALSIAVGDIVDGADGVILEGGEGMGMARAAAGPDALVGAATRSLDEATLALEVGADFVVHGPGVAGALAVDGLRDRVRVPFYVGLLRGVAECARVVERGIIRVAVDGAGLDPADPVGEAAHVSRLLGRSI